MPNFEENKTYSKEAYGKTEENEAGLKAQIAGAKSADEMMEIAMKLKALEGNKNELVGNAQEEAAKEDEERKAHDEATAEDAERKMYDEAKNEDTEREQTKTKGKSIKELDEATENLKKQLGGVKSADEMISLAAQMKELENKRNEIAKTNLEEMARKDKEDSAGKAEEILRKLNGESVIEKEKSPEEKMDDYIAQFKKLGGKAGDYNIPFQTMRDDKAIDFLNNDAMILRYVKGMDNVGALYPLLAYDREKVYSKNIVLEIINSLPKSDTSDFYYGGYHQLEILAENSNLAKDKDVIEAIVRKNRFMALDLFSQSSEEGRKAAKKIIEEGPDAYFK